MDSDRSRHPLAVITEMHGQLDQLDQWGCDPAPTAAANAAEALAKVESLQAELASLRRTITEPSAPLSMGERVAASHHLQVIAGSLGVLHKAFRRIASDEGCSHAQL